MLLVKLMWVGYIVIIWKSMGHIMWSQNRKSNNWIKEMQQQLNKWTIKRADEPISYTDQLRPGVIFF